MAWFPYRKGSCINSPSSVACDWSHRKERVRGGAGRAVSTEKMLGTQGLLSGASHLHLPPELGLEYPGSLSRSKFLLPLPSPQKADSWASPQHPQVLHHPQPDTGPLSKKWGNLDAGRDGVCPQSLGSQLTSSKGAGALHSLPALGSS